MDSPATYSGSCLCGGIRFRVRGPLAPLQVCHCVSCRKAQGGPFATNLPVDLAAFELLAGAALLREFESSPGKLRCFCGHCGSPVYSRRPALPGVVRVRAGLLDGALPVAAATQAHVASRANWWPALHDLPEIGS
jgi:hypothetical protein